MVQCCFKFWAWTASVISSCTVCECLRKCNKEQCKPKSFPFHKKEKRVCWFSTRSLCSGFLHLYFFFFVGFIMCFLPARAAQITLLLWETLSLFSLTGAFKWAEEESPLPGLIHLADEWNHPAQEFLRLCRPWIDDSSIYTAVCLRGALNVYRERGKNIFSHIKSLFMQFYSV